MVTHDSRGRTWPQFVAQWLINEHAWVTKPDVNHHLLRLVLSAQFLGLIDRDTAKAYFRQ